MTYSVGQLLINLQVTVVSPVLIIMSRYTENTVVKDVVTTTDNVQSTMNDVDVTALLSKLNFESASPHTPWLTTSGQPYYSQVDDTAYRFLNWFSTGVNPNKLYFAGGYPIKAGLGRVICTLDFNPTTSTQYIIQPGVNIQ